MSEFVKDLVSIVTPVYNGEGHLFRLLDSVLAQSYGHIEMILADDGSTDGTIALAESYRERFEERGYSLRIVRGEHSCAAGAINLGLPCVTGEFLIWPDSDDALHPESVSRRVEFLREHPQYSCVRSLQEYVDEKTGEVKRPDEKIGELRKEDLFFDILEFRTFVCCGCYMLKSEEFFKIYPDRRIPVYDVGQNFQMLLPFMYSHRCPTLQERLYRVYTRENSHSRTKLTEEQERDRYRKYENMVDELASICQISSKTELWRIYRWKLWRRLILETKYKTRDIPEYKRELYLLLAKSWVRISFARSWLEYGEDGPRIPAPLLLEAARLWDMSWNRALSLPGLRLKLRFRLPEGVEEFPRRLVLTADSGDLHMERELRLSSRRGGEVRAGTVLRFPAEAVKTAGDIELGLRLPEEDGIVTFLFLRRGQVGDFVDFRAEKPIIVK